MDTFIFILLIMAAFGGDSDSKKKVCKKRKSYSRRTKRDNYSWVDYAWFHDHHQSI